MTVHILIVEDNREMADLYALWLSDSYTVHKAYTGREALELLSENIDIVLLDRKMPGLSGDAILDRIRDQNLDCQVAMVTAVDPDFDIINLEFDAYITKPISKDELQDSIDRLLTRAEYEEPLQEYFTARAQQETLGHAQLSNSLNIHQEDDEGKPKIDMDEVSAHSLPPAIANLADEYETTLGHRDRFLLKWLHIVFSFFALSSVHEEFAKQARGDKTLASMFVMLLDDIGERHKDFATLTEVSKLPFDHQPVNYDAPGVNEAYLEMAESVWDTLQSRLEDAPRYDEIESLLQFDLRQVIHAIRYSMLVSERPEIANLQESEAIETHNMMMLAYAEIDLAYSPGVKNAELGKLRSLILRLQKMARIGNWITTWERELTERDFSSGVIVYALENDIISPEDLDGIAEDDERREQVGRAIRQASVEEVLIDQWQDRLNRLRENPPEIDSINVEGLIDGIEQVMAYHLASRGLK
ncbi:MAG: response regulator transcription factor [Halodesulfurarchaeum sp.]|nr:response regulator transcription factor [Halodesulfurarchaeum sp.]